jgi:glucokinase
LLVDLDLPVWSPWLTEPLAQQSLQDAQLHRGGRVNLVVPDGIGVGGFLREAADIPDSALRSALHWLRQSPQARALEAGQAGRFCTTNFERQSAPHRGSEQPDPAVFEISAGCTPSGPAAPTDGEWALVFDVGGTHLRTAVYRHPAEEIAAMHTRPTPNFLRHDGESPGEIRARLLGEMAAAADQVLGKKRPRVVAISFAGPLDAQRRVMAAPTIWGEQEGGPVDLLSELQALWPSARIVLENDVTAAGYRFLRSSADSLGIVTVSSGIGNKVFINGRPVVGPAGRGGEIGHIRVDDSADAPLCNCGGRGHLGAISSGRGVLEFARRTAVDQPAGFGRSLLGRLADGDACRITNPHIVTAFHDLDPFTMDVLRRASRPLAQTLATIHLGIGIERFVIIGGFAMALSDPYRLLLAELAREHCWEMGQNWREMIELGDPNGDCTLIGIGRRAFQFQEEDANGDGGRTGATIQLPEAIRLRAA